MYLFSFCFMYMYYRGKDKHSRMIDWLFSVLYRIWTILVTREYNDGGSYLTTIKLKQRCLDLDFKLAAVDYQSDGTFFVRYGSFLKRHGTLLARCGSVRFLGVVEMFRVYTCYSCKNFRTKIDPQNIACLYVYIGLIRISKNSKCCRYGTIRSLSRLIMCRNVLNNNSSEECHDIWSF